jgi:hypothetical protein
MEDVSLLPDGTRMVVQEAGRGLVLVSPEQPDSGTTLVDQAEQPQRPRVSRDGRWLAYTAIAFGRREVFVRSMAGGPSRWQVSRNGGLSPIWSRSGRELFFLTDDSLYTARISTDPTFAVDNVRSLFRVPPFSLRSGIDVLPGDSQFVMIATELDARDRIAVTVNFDESVRALTAPRRERQ